MNPKINVENKPIAIPNSVLGIIYKDYLWLRLRCILKSCATRIIKLVYTEKHTMHQGLALTLQFYTITVYILINQPPYTLCICLFSYR